MRLEQIYDKHQKEREIFLNNIQIPVDKLNKQLLTQTLTHKSFAADLKNAIPHNERLEFVGDSILGAAISSLLFKEFPDMKESEMTLCKIMLVKEETLANIARKIKLYEVILISNGEEKMAGRDKNSILSDCLEALIAYIFLEQGYEPAQQRIKTYIYSELAALRGGSIKTYKTLIQEYIQKTDKLIPSYEDTEYKKDTKGNVTQYQSNLIHKEKIIATGYGANKKIAQENAAKQAYHKLLNLK